MPEPTTPVTCTCGPPPTTPAGHRLNCPDWAEGADAAPSAGTPQAECAHDPDDQAAPANPATALRDAIDAAIRPNMLFGLQDAELDGPGGTQRINEWADWITGAVVGVLEAEVDQLRTQVQQQVDAKMGVAGEWGNALADLAAMRTRAEAAEEEVARLLAESPWLRASDEDRQAAEATIRRAQAECDRIETAVRANPTAPDFDGAYLACLGHIRAALTPTKPATGSGEQP